MACSGISWQELLDGIRDAFSTDRVDIDQVKKLMDSYQSQRTDWEQYALFDPHTYVHALIITAFIKAKNMDLYKSMCQIFFIHMYAGTLVT